MIVSPVARASAMMPREIAVRTPSICSSEKPCAIHQRGPAVPFSSSYSSI